MPDPAPAMDPVFILIYNQIERVSEEIEKGARFLEKQEAIRNLYPEDGSWIIGNSLAIALLNSYNWLERALEHVAVYVDDFNPSGAGASFKLLEQMTRETSLRPAVLTPELHAVLYDLRRLRHALLHGYENPIVAENLVERFGSFRQEFWPSFLESMERVRDYLESEEDSDDANRSKSS